MVASLRNSLIVASALVWIQGQSIAFTRIPAPRYGSQMTSALLESPKDSECEEEQYPSRRFFLLSVGATAMASAGVFPQAASAGIDVSGLAVEGGSGNPGLASQLKAYDGSGTTRVREVKSIQEASAPPPVSVLRSSSSISPADDRQPIATWAYRANPGFSPSLSRAGKFGNLYRYNDQILAPTGSTQRAIGVQFEFPSDWLQLDRNIGGIQYVDQRNGDKLYVFRAPLPTDASLETVPKATIGDLIFDTQGSLTKSGQTIEEYKVSSAQILSDCPAGTCATHRRFKIKYATVTGNGLQVERRALVDAYQVENDVYMLMTSSNAVKFEQKDSLERETVENIVSSFRIEI